jgi:hypothetical protein
MLKAMTLSEVTLSIGERDVNRRVPNVGVHRNAVTTTLKKLPIDPGEPAANNHRGGGGEVHKRQTGHAGKQELDQKWRSRTLKTGAKRSHTIQKKAGTKMLVRITASDVVPPEMRGLLCWCVRKSASKLFTDNRPS